MGQIQHTTCFVKKKKKSIGTQPHATFIYLHIVCGCSRAKTAEMSNCDRDHMAHKPKIFTIGLLYKKGCKLVDLLALTSGSDFGHRHLCFLMRFPGKAAIY